MSDMDQGFSQATSNLWKPGVRVIVSFVISAEQRVGGIDNFKAKKLVLECHHKQNKSLESPDTVFQREGAESSVPETCT